jgi:hypothetical protein
MRKAPSMFARLYDKWYVPIVLALFAIHFLAGTLCGISQSIPINNHFNTYMRPGFLLLTSPLPRVWFQQNVLGYLLYVGTMLFYSALLAAAVLGVMTAVHALRRIRVFVDSAGPTPYQ